MKMRLKQILAVALLTAAFITGTAVSSYAQDKPCCKEKGEGKHCEAKGPHKGRPELTKEQQTKIGELRVTLQKDCLGLRNQIAEKRAHLKTISTADQPDMAAINKTIDEIYALRGEIAKKKAAFTQEIRKLLTPEQRLQFDLNHDKRGKGDREDNGGGPGCQKQGEGCQHHGQGCQNKEGGCQHQGQGCQHKGEGCPHQKDAEPQDEKK
jgi:Spy/CpxP family protein refolding chaperone